MRRRIISLVLGVALAMGFTAHMLPAANAATDTVTVAGAFEPASVAPGASLTLTLTATVSASGNNYSFGLTDTLPAGLVPSKGSFTCGSGTTTVTSGDVLVDAASPQKVSAAPIFNGGKVTSCTFTIPIAVAANVVPGTYSDAITLARVGNDKSSILTVANNGTLTVTPVAVSSVTLDPATGSLAVGGSLTLKATIAPSNATNQTLTWSSSDDTIATVDSSGVVTAVAVGSATITATANDGSNASGNADITVTDGSQPPVTVAVTGVALDQSSASMIVGDTLTLTATVSPSDATDQTVTWTSSDETVATVDSNGVVTALTAGSATITVTTTDGGFTASVDVNVTEPSVTVMVTDVILDQTSASVAVGNTLTLAATVSPSDATDQTVVWSSSDETIATVVNGVVTGVAAGQVTIIATAHDGGGAVATAVITVTDTTANIAVTGVSVSPETVPLTVGDTANLTATVTPADASDKSVTWTSSDTGVATVDSSGMVTAVAAGTATITVTTTDGGKTASAAVTVLAKVVPASPVPMYRIFNPSTGEHFYTASPKEAQVNVASGAWKYEGIGWYAPSSGIPVYRLAAIPGSGSAGHLFTTSAQERDAALASKNPAGQPYWKCETSAGMPNCVGWYSGGTIPVFRAFYPGNGQHNYTTDTNEQVIITTLQGWTDEKIGWYGVQKGNSGAPLPVV